MMEIYQIVFVLGFAAFEIALGLGFFGKI